MLRCIAVCCSVQVGVLCCFMLQSVAAQCVAVCCSAF